MGIKDVFNQAPTLEEEALYKQVLDEVESGVMRKGIYAKALADSSGDGGKAQSLYIKYRVQSLVDDQKSVAELQKLALKETRAKEKQDAKIQADYVWEHETSRSTKIVYYIIGAAIMFPIIFWLDPGGFITNA
jgi:hypothetical protein